VCDSQEIRRWCEEVQEECGAESMQSVFCGFHEGTLPSLMLALASVSPTTQTEVDSKWVAPEALHPI
jgi:hypothetical protein